jgi:alkanesulfonate monooxygenase SsuD/methylene tetrahydromethanopterin reductase-like flavin-dependent oxidoreductase (luciferase family)
MHIGYATTFQNPQGMFSDREVWNNEVRMAELADQLGFGSIWSTEHHFTDYEMIPNPLQFLTFIAARTKRAKLGTMVVVLPWHDPIRVAEEISVVENLSDGRMILGLGRGLATVEFDGFRVDMNESRERFNESVHAILNALETGVIECHGKHYNIPARNLRPLPLYSFRGRTFGAGGSPETMPAMAKLGVGMLIIPTKGWKEIDADFNAFRTAWREHHPTAPVPKPVLDQFCFIDKDPGRARELAEKYIGVYYNEILKHYNMTGEHFAKTKGYEFYAKYSSALRADASKIVRTFLDMQSWGTPARVLEQLSAARSHVDMSSIVIHFLYGGMPAEEGERNIRMFAEDVLPTLKTWEPDPFAKLTPLNLRAPNLAEQKSA